MFDFINKWFGGGFNARMVKQYQKTVKLINDYESKISILSDEDLAHKTVEFKELLANGKTLDDILPEAFAVVREASKRVLGLRHFDVQLIGGIALHEGKIAEMRTGEGKTLVATSPVYLNALSGKGVHVVTVNDYLAKRDGEQMGQVYGFLGLTTSVIVSGMGDFRKKEAYAADITYGTNHEFGFDYLRDNLKFRVQDMVMRPFNYALVDEVDSILIDEARTPLIISGPDDNASQMYVDVNAVVKDITEEDYEKDPKTRAINLTEAGIAKIEKRLMDIGLIDSPLYDSSNVSMVYYVNCALKANKLFKRDVDYMVKDGQILIIDEFTGRTMEGRRYSEGLHQALEAKEGVEVQAESQTIASISYQNLFRMYPKLAGMTGTAMTEEAEFDEIYKLKVVTIPTNKPVVRIDHEDSIFLTLEEKDRAVVKLIKDCYQRRQPVLVGTTNLDRSEYISSLLTREGIRHNVLNAKQHEREAIIISEAGSPGAVTIATNMAGRGTDIKLGGSAETRIAIECRDIEDPVEREEKIRQIQEDVKVKNAEVIKLGGLFVVGTERNESRRIDNQLRGRSGRQGDPGASKYFLSLEDDLIKRFGSPNLKNMLKKLGVKKDEDLTHRWISKAIEKAQQRVEAYNFDIRKHLLKYDDVMNEQRKMIYSQRLNLMQSEDLSEYTDGIILDTLENICDLYTSPEAVPFEWKLDDLQRQLKNIFDIEIDKEKIANDPNMTYELLKQQLQDQVKEKLTEIKERTDPDYLKDYEKNLTLKTLDGGWKKHLVTLEHLRRGINLQSYAQKNPLNEYKFAAFNIFDDMLNGVRKEITTNIMHMQDQPKQSFDDDFDDDFDFNFDDNEDPREKLKKLLEQWKEMKEKNIPIHKEDNQLEDNSNNDNNDYSYIDNEESNEDSDNEKNITEDTNTNYLYNEEEDGQNEYNVDEEYNTENKNNIIDEDSYSINNNTIREPVNNLKNNEQVNIDYRKVASRNSLCPCGSGRKYKECHGKLQQMFFTPSNEQNKQENIKQNIQNNNILNNINQDIQDNENINQNMQSNNIEDNEQYFGNERKKYKNPKAVEDDVTENNTEDFLDNTDIYSSNNTEISKDKNENSNEKSLDNNDLTSKNDAYNTINDKYETPQEILFKFAEDQREAIFGNNQKNNNSNIYDNEEEINTKNDSQNIVNIKSKNKMNDNEIEKNNINNEQNVVKMKQTEIITNNNDVINNQKVKEHINCIKEDNNNIIEYATEGVIKQKVGRKKKVKDNVTEDNSDNNIIDNLPKKNIRKIQKDISNSQVDDSCEMNIKNIQDNNIKSNKIKNDKDELQSEFNESKVAKQRKTRSKKQVSVDIDSEIQINSDSKYISKNKDAKNNNVNNINEEKIVKKSTKTKRVKKNNSENDNNIENINDINDDNDLIEKPNKRGRKKVTK